LAAVWNAAVSVVTEAATAAIGGCRGLNAGRSEGQDTKQKDCNFAHGVFSLWQIMNAAA
jgi:hypothetical protein